MNKVAESAAHTALSRIQSTTGLAEVGDGAEFAVDGAAGVPAGIEFVAGLLSGFFVLEARVDVAYEICCGTSSAWGKPMPETKTGQGRKREGI